MFIPSYTHYITTPLAQYQGSLGPLRLDLMFFAILDSRFHEGIHVELQGLAHAVSVLRLDQIM